MNDDDGNDTKLCALSLPAVVWNDGIGFQDGQCQWQPIVRRRRIAARSKRRWPLKVAIVEWCCQFGRADARQAAIASLSTRGWLKSETGSADICFRGRFRVENESPFYFFDEFHSHM